MTSILDIRSSDPAGCTNEPPGLPCVSGARPGRARGAATFPIEVPKFKLALILLIGAALCGPLTAPAAGVTAGNSSAESPPPGSGARNPAPSSSRRRRSLSTRAPPARSRPARFGFPRAACARRTASSPAVYPSFQATSSSSMTASRVGRASSCSWRSRAAARIETFCITWEIASRIPGVVCSDGARATAASRPVTQRA